MTEIPSWVIYAAGIYFVVQTLFVLSLGFGVMTLLKSVKQITPKVEAIAQNVESISHKVDHLADTVNDTVASVGARAKNVAGSAEHIAHSTSKAFEKYSPYIAALMSGVKILQAVQEFQKLRRAHHAATSHESDEPRKVDKKPVKKA